MAQSKPALDVIAAQQATQTALALIGAQAYMEIVKLWGDVALNSGQATRSGIRTFLAQAAKVIAVRRKQSQQITVAFERLQRTIKVGQPIALPDYIDTKRPHETLDEMYADFEATLKQLAPSALKPKLTPKELAQGDLQRVDQTLGKPKGLPKVDKLPFKPPAPSDEGGKKVKVQELRGLLEELERLEKFWEDQTKKAMAATAADASVRAKAAPDNAKAEHELAGRKLGSAAAANVRGASHEISSATGSRDSKVIGWVRVHTSFDSNGPCAFCALMLSRGATYKSKASAGGAVGSRFQFHPNCKCQAQALYKGDNYDTDPRFEINRFYRKKWDDNFKGRPTDEARRSWRNYIDAFNKGQVS